MTLWDRAILGSALAVIVVCLGLALWIMVEWLTAETLELRKDTWTCTRTRVASSITPVFNGKTTMLLPSSHAECVEYRRKDGE